MFDILYILYYNTLQEMYVIFFYSLFKYDNLEWDFRSHHQSFLPQILF